jgi:hypothetical protein
VSVDLQNNNRNFLSSSFGESPIVLTHESALSDDDLPFSEGSFDSISSHDGYASFWNGTPPSISVPLSPLIDDLSDGDPLTPVIPETPPGGWPQSPEQLVDDQQLDDDFFGIPLTPNLDLINEAVFLEVPDFPF